MTNTQKEDSGTDTKVDIVTSSERRRRVLDPATLFSALALLVSFAALFVSLYETSILETQNRAAVWPYLQLTTSYGEDGWGIKISNRGVGPARVTSQFFSVNTKEVTDPLVTLKEIAGGDPGFGYNILYASDVSNSVLSPDIERRIFFLPWTDQTRPVIEKLTKAYLRASICYCSIFGDCWRAELNRPARRDDTCPKPED